MPPTAVTTFLRSLRCNYRKGDPHYFGADLGCIVRQAYKDACEHDDAAEPHPNWQPLLIAGLDAAIAALQAARAELTREEDARDA